MDIEKFTERARGFLQAAQTIAIREFHQQLTPEHLLKALLDDEEGAAAGLIRAAGGDDKSARATVDAEIARQPKVQGGGAGQPQVTPTLMRVLDSAQQAATKAGDEYVAQDRVLIALANGDGGAARALRSAGATPQALEKAVADIRKGRKVTSQAADVPTIRLIRPAPPISKNVLRKALGSTVDARWPQMLSEGVSASAKMVTTGRATIAAARSAATVQAGDRWPKALWPPLKPASAPVPGGPDVDRWLLGVSTLGAAVIVVPGLE